MTFTADHLTSLRQEITALSNMNVLFSHTSEHSPVEQTASDVRVSRLLQIKQELSDMRNSPAQPAVWWDKHRTKSQTHAKLFPTS
jgi:hypothetical protein